MSKSSRVSKCQTELKINGEVFDEILSRKGIAIDQLAQKAGVKEQTIKNYLNSRADKRQGFNLEKANRICEVLGIKLEEILIELPAISGNKSSSEFGGPIGWIGGKWRAVCTDLEIPNFLTYGKEKTDGNEETDWDADLEIHHEPGTSVFTFEGVDKDRDRFDGNGIIQHVNWISLTYHLFDDRLDQFGVVFAEFKPDRKTIDGLLVGRESKHESNRGIVLSQIVLTLQESG